MVGVQLSFFPGWEASSCMAAGRGDETVVLSQGSLRLEAGAQKPVAFPLSLVAPCSETLQKEGFGLVFLLTLQHVWDDSELRSLQGGTFLPRTGSLLLWVVHGVPGNQHQSPTDHQGARVGRSF